MPKARLEHNKGLPKRWDFTHGAYYYRVPPKQQPILGAKRVLLAHELEAAHSAFGQLQRCIIEGLSWNKADASVGASKLPANKRTQRWGSAAFAGIPNRFLREVWYGAKFRARRRSTEFTLTFDDMKAMADRADGRCEITGIYWDFNSVVSGSMKRPWIPSLDRCDAAKGYTLDNCRMVCWAVNIALSDWGEAVLKRLFLSKGWRSMAQRQMLRHTNQSAALGEK